MEGLRAETLVAETLVEVMEVSVSRLCRYANYDPSTIFRFRSGARQPAEPERFADAVAAYVSRELDDVQHREIAGELLDVDGPCGGYNLHWAWASGMLAGGGAARMLAGGRDA